MGASVSVGVLTCVCAVSPGTLAPEYCGEPPYVWVLRAAVYSTSGAVYTSVSEGV